MVSSRAVSHMFVYSRNGRYIFTIKFNIDDDKLLDATWTPSSNIVYTTKRDKVVAISGLVGNVSTKHTIHTHLRRPMYLSVSNDDVIFLADFYQGVYQSTDEGISWSLVFKSPDGLYFIHVIKVETANNPDFWILREKHNNYYIRVYSVDERRPNGNVTWRDINIPQTNGKYIDVSNCLLSYDGSMNIFLFDSKNKAVHVFSVNDQYHYQLLSPEDIMHIPGRLAIDKKSQELLVGQERSVVEVFKLTYGHCCA